MGWVRPALWRSILYRHGLRVQRLLAAAGIVGPALVNGVREAQIAAGVPRAEVCDRTMSIVSGLLVLSLIANALRKPIGERRFMSDAESTSRQMWKSTGGAPPGSFGIDTGVLFS